MKFVKGISLFLLYPAIILVAGMYIGIMLDRYFYPGRGVREEPTGTIESTDIAESTVENAVAAVSSKEEVIGADTDYIIEEHDTRRDTLIENHVSVPVKYLGMNREEFVAAMELYAMAPPLSEQERGFVGLEVRSFSAGRVVVRMHYAYVEPSRSFFIRVEDNHIVVYCDDEETVYMYTNISADALPGYIQTQVSIGMFMEDEESLYHFLETYSS
ncbi:MAG: hypothetical protein ACI4EQ_00080 [Lachnospiraceae bacterium]